ncbi:MAG: mechanosensitive ion channel [Bacteroidales bacterium]|nr:mechanosensitive ion channel [Bacteroidales bacterium]
MIKVLKKYINIADISIIKKIFSILKSPVLGVIILSLINIYFSVYFKNEEWGIYIRKTLSVLFILTITWLIIRIIKVIRIIILTKYNIQQDDNLEARKAYTQIIIIERILIFFIIIISTAIILMTFESIRKIGIGLFASAGIAGIILGFAAQKLIATIIAGIQIAITQPIRIDDVVIVENEWGRIEEITLTYVVVRIWDKRRLILPTTYFIEKPFQNWTRVSADLLGTVFIYSDYTIPIDEIRKELDRILETTDLWDGKINVVQVTNATEKIVEIRILVSAADSSTLFDLRVFIREKIITFLQKNYPGCLPKTRIVINNK